jgi:hypothetical protein
MWIRTGIFFFSKTKKPESFCSTKDALNFHLKRVHDQSMVLRNADCAMPTLPNPVDMGWTSNDMGLQPILMSLSPIPASCVEIIYCSCKKTMQISTI